METRLRPSVSSSWGLDAGRASCRGAALLYTGGMEQAHTFGQMLRAARRQAGLSTLRAFADLLSEHGLVYSDEAIGHWENDRRRPDRATLLVAAGVLAARGGWESFVGVQALFESLDYRAPDGQECAAYFPAFSSPAYHPALPPRPYDRLIGRDDLLTDLSRRLSDPDSKPVMVLSGLGGIGKTALAYELVQRVLGAGRFDRLAWQGARSEEFVGTSVRRRVHQPLDWPALLVGMARQLGLEHLLALHPDQLEMQIGASLADGGALLVLDNLESLEAARDVADALFRMVGQSGGAAPSRVLITSRERLVDRAYALDYPLGGLSEVATVELFTLEAGLRGAGGLLDLSAETRSRLYAVTGGMPLAIKLLVSQALLGIALDAELSRLQAAVDEEDLYRFIYFRLWERLSMPAQQVLVAAAGFPASAEDGMLRRVSGLDEVEYRPAVGELVRLSLLQVFPVAHLAQQRCDLHALTRWFVNAPLAEVWARQMSSPDRSPD